MLGSRFTLRITPAGAGKTSCLNGQSLPTGDHPRRCGENYKQSLTRCRRLGSPPQVRGKHKSCFHVLKAVGITPAGAGKTCAPAHKDCNRQDHPRRCGENYTGRTRAPHEQGSPPQVRGKLGDKSNQSAPFGITPAGAGKTVLSTSDGRRGRDHPRRCGENLSGKTPPPTTPGSPPQVRGKLHKETVWAAAQRITPAGAGKTKGYCFVQKRRQDHPRRCGENEKAMDASCKKKGSPPQVRGKRPKSKARRLRERITPAGAGKT